MLRKLQLQLVADLGDLTPFLSNCPALEWLSIIRSFVPHLVVPQTTCFLRHLHISGCDIESIELHAISMTIFEYDGQPYLPIKVNDSLKLSKASINLYWVHDTVGYFWDGLSCSLSHIDQLVLGFSMNIDTTRLIKNPTKFVHLRHLVLFCFIFYDPMSADVVLRLTQIFEAAPQLEHFVLHALILVNTVRQHLPTPTRSPQDSHHDRRIWITGSTGAGKIHSAECQCSRVYDPKSCKEWISRST